MTNRDPGRQDDYRIDVEDFGPIQRASVDVRPFTVFIGPSNTGKSYLAVLIYALHRSLRMGYDWTPWPALATRIGRATSTPGDEILRDLRTWAGVASGRPPGPSLPRNVTSYIEALLRDAKWLEADLTDELRRCFGVDRLDVLVRRPGSGDGARIGFSGAGEVGPVTARYEFRFGSGDHRLSGQVLPTSSHLPDAAGLKRMATASTTLISFENDTIEEEFDTGAFFQLVVAHLFRAFIAPMYRRVHYLPADRTGVMHSHQVVVSTLVQSATTAGLRPSTNIPMLSGVLADFLNQLIGMSGERRSARGEPVAELAAGLEHAVLKGAVQLARTETGYPRFMYRPAGWKDDLPLMRTSSMVSELAPVVLYVRHLVQRGDVLIIEEPESHLHPGMQAAFARELARLVRAGVRIVITTHSEWFLEQIGNLVSLSSLPENRREGITGADVALSPEEVGAWLFKPGPQGSVVEEVEVDPETGLFPTDYDEVSQSLYNEGADIFNRLQEGSRE
ncbi:MAG: AAA family ATPase [Acidobacteria bacterium]|nr:AAA family ATPase [Acidobacteriota bacterium]